jgi:hypothetical protein
MFSNAFHWGSETVSFLSGPDLDRRLLTEKFPMMADKRAMKDHRSKLSDFAAPEK